ncbi:lysylphosphatidylglycerol synthase transmembrane domain-containing protein [Limisalsivibrio acetivorans]|uniref:lysylphosphatidylglycerol synthase transmembrane domain-containing protein n=1 Tax=Limisalsivibrio acetivorans TaxID=1304888 RepID=UPI0003B6A0B5|nr:lysylphosphatidylglycerol synthase transmembrane domain-containing protein [Limisalsivibrio acetivorans]
MITNIIKFAVSAVLLFFVFRMVDFGEFFAITASASIPLILGALILQTLSTITASYRWYLIMNALKFPGSVLFYGKSYFKGSYFNQVLPGSIGGDAVRILEVSNAYKCKKREAFYGIFIDRIVGLLGLLALNFAANLINRGLLPEWLYKLIMGIGLVGFGGFFMFLLIAGHPFFTKYQLLRLFHNIRARFLRVYNSAKNIAVQSGLSLLTHLFSVLSIFALGNALGLDYPLYVYMVTVPPVLLLLIVPISLAGWGVREGAMVGIFMLVGAPRESVLSISILYGLILIVSSLPGMYFWVKGKGKY